VARAVSGPQPLGSTAGVGGVELGERDVRGSGHGVRHPQAAQLSFTADPIGIVDEVAAIEMTQCQQRQTLHDACAVSNLL
jgi:hypothetical protein